MGKPLDLIGARFGRLTVTAVGNPGVNTYGKPVRRWLCACDCGKAVTLPTGKLTGRHTSSCGCYRDDVLKTCNTTHGLRYRPEYRVWNEMKQRCHNPNNHGYGRYGAKGIAVCDRWMVSFSAFFDDMGPRPAGMTIDRVDGAKGYSPDNCRWATPSEQANNLRTTRFFTVDGITDTITGFSSRWGCSRDAIKLRLKRGQDIAHIARVMTGADMVQSGWERRAHAASVTLAAGGVS